MTKTQVYDGYSGGRQCSAIADFKGRKGGCRNAARYPDSDGVRWWCDEHNPKAKVSPEAENLPEKPAPKSTVSEISGMAEALVHITETAMKALSDVQACRPVGWESTDPAEKYRILLDQACNIAASAHKQLREDLKQIVG